MKIAILGYSGSGKSTLAACLGERLGLAVLHLDSVNFLPNWELRERNEMNAIVGEFLDENENWVVDGTYKKCCLKRRMEEADLVIFLFLNRFTCFFRAWKRYRKYKGKTRTDMATGCSEKFDFEFARWLLWEGRTKRRKDAFKVLLKEYGEKAVVVKTQRELTALLKKITGLKK